MIVDDRFFLPGPTEVRTEVLEAMQHPMVPHRGAAMELLMQTIHGRLQPLFGTTRPVYVVTGSATASMEMAVRSGSVERVLAVVCGEFGERFARIAECTGRTVTRVITEPGETVSPEQVRLALEHDDYDTVTVVHSETSTGALSDVPGIARVVREASNAMLLVDAVTSVGAMPVEMDAWGADLVLTGSQKALALPPGLSFVAASERLLDRARTLPDRGLALDLVQHHQFWEKSQSPTTPAIPLLFALDRQLADIQFEGLQGRFARHAQMAQTCWDWVEVGPGAELSLQVLASERERSPTVSCVLCERPDEIVRALNERGFVIGGGMGALRQSAFRIGHMGDHTVAGLEALLEVLGDVIRSLG